MNVAITESTCLAIIDVQNGFVNENTEHIPRLVEGLQDMYPHVIASRFINEVESPFRRFMNWGKFAESSNSRELAFRPAESAFVFNKPTYTIWTPEVRAFLASHDVGEVHLVGIDTDVCVLVSAVDLFQNGIRPVVRSQFCASHGGPEYDQAALVVLQRLIGREQIDLGPRVRSIT